MKRFISLLKRDIIIASRNHYVTIVIIIAFILVGVVNFVIPEKVENDLSVIYAVADEKSGVENPLLQFLGSDAKNQKVGSRQEVIEQMKKNRESIGVVFGGSDESYEIIFQGYENERSRNSIMLTFEALQNKTITNGEIVQTKILKDMGQKFIPFNKNFVPLIILNEPVMLGFALLATLIFMEKEEKTLKAYRTTPGNTAVFLLSKLLVMILLGLLSTIFVTLFTIGIKVNWFMLIIVVILGIAFGSTVAMFLGSLFNNITEAMIWILGISILFTVPMISYFSPGFAPKIITMIPTYNLMFALREIYFPMGNTEIIYDSIIMLVLLSSILFISSVLMMNRNTVE